MPGVEVDKPRVLMLEGNLKFRDPTTARVQTVCTHAVCVSDVWLAIVLEVTYSTVGLVLIV